VTDKWLKAAKNARTPSDRRKFTRKHQALKIRNEIAGCENCGLHEKRTQTVPFDNDRPRAIAFVGEAPGRQEDETGIPFVGRSGRLLDEIIESTGNRRSDAVVLNTLACRPPHNRKPTKEESTACRPNFDKQLDFTGAWVVVLLGGSALNQIRPGSITELRGKPFWQQGRIYIPTFHPAYILRKPKLKAELAADIRLAFKIVNGSEWWEPFRIEHTMKPNREGDKYLANMIDAHGYAVIKSAKFDDTIVVVKDTIVKVPPKYHNFIRYTIQELVRIGEMGRGHGLPTSELRAIHALKSLGATVIR